MQAVAKHLWQSQFTRHLVEPRELRQASKCRAMLAIAVVNRASATCLPAGTTRGRSVAGDRDFGQLMGAAGAATP